MIKTIAPIFALNCVIVEWTQDWNPSLSLTLGKSLHLFEPFFSPLETKGNGAYYQEASGFSWSSPARPRSGPSRQSQCCSMKCTPKLSVPLLMPVFQVDIHKPRAQKRRLTCMAGPVEERYRQKECCGQMQGRSRTKGSRHIKGKKMKLRLGEKWRGQLEHQDDMKKLLSQEPRI